MIGLLIQNVRHILRTRLLFFLLLFSVVVQCIGLRLLNSLTLSFAGHVVIAGALIDKKEVLFVSLFLQLFTGSFLAAVYGIWLVPYLHRGPRAGLVYPLPIPRWQFVFCYAFSMLALLLVLFFVLFASYLMVFGVGFFFDAEVPWKLILSGLGMEALSFEVLMFAFAFSSLSLGEVGTFFVGMTTILTLQAGAVLLRINAQFIRFQNETISLTERIYNALPPVGELVFDLWKLFRGEGWSSQHLILWGGWWIAFLLLFALKLGTSAKSRSAES